MCMAQVLRFVVVAPYFPWFSSSLTLLRSSSASFGFLPTCLPAALALCIPALDLSEIIFLSSLYRVVNIAIAIGAFLRLATDHSAIRQELRNLV